MTDSGVVFTLTEVCIGLRHTLSIYKPFLVVTDSSVLLVADGAFENCSIQFGSRQRLVFPVIE